jgi:hypothetical protein
MTTYYRPTERRGKVVTYRSIDPEEQKRIQKWNRIITKVSVLATIGIFIFLFVSELRR